MDLTRLPHSLDKATRRCRAVVETPRGSRCKYSYDPESGLFELSAQLPEGIAFPLDFGFVPGAQGGDRDPIDIMVLADDPLPIGTLLTVRLIGALEAEDHDENGARRNDRLVGVAAVSRLHAHVQALHDLGREYIDGLIRFWVEKDRRQGKRFELLRIASPEAAVALLVGAATPDRISGA